MGAIGEDGVRVVNHDVLRMTGLGDLDIDEAEHRERMELDRRAMRYREGRKRAELVGRCAVVVDDGIATGSSARAACEVARALGAARIVLAAPVASRLAVVDLRQVCDEFVCLEVPEPFFAVGEWYRDFSQTTDDQVIEMVRRAAVGQERGRAASPGGEGVVRSEADVEVRCGDTNLTGSLSIPSGARGTVVFAHGSGSGRRSARNRYVAALLNEAGLATLLFDLLTTAEEKDRSRVFDVPLLAGRLADVTRWASAQPEIATTTVGYFGASTGAAAALWAAAQPDCGIAAVVSRGGRPDLAAPCLAAVTAPTLLIVGESDELVLGLNQNAQAALRCQNHLAVVPGAGHLFEEPGALAAVAELARDWFITNLATAA